jgi:hypothetical protein
MFHACSAVRVLREIREIHEADRDRGWGSRRLSERRDSFARAANHDFVQAIGHQIDYNT